jgi:hypothetical protein
MTWVILWLFCPIKHGRCEKAPDPPPEYHYFDQERCERERDALVYAHAVPEGKHLVRVCIESRWPA